MRIVQIAPLEETVPPHKYGGTELVISLLTEELVRLGHEVYLLAAGDSQTQSHLIPITPKSLRRLIPISSQQTWRDYWKQASIATIIETINRLQPDIIHNQYAWRLILFESLIKYPIMSTLHGPLTSYPEIQTYTHHSHHPYISISTNQRRALPKLNWVKTIYHGLDLTNYPSTVNQNSRDYFAFLGRTSPEKGLAEIIQLIRQSPYSLKIAAKVDPVDQAYFDSQIKPFIDGTKIQFLGEVDHADKIKLLSHARALLLWLNWEEPFGLVILEANACGAPVIVNRRGSMPELVKNGETGYLVNTQAQFLAKLAEAEKLSPLVCRQHIEAQFTVQHMAQNYVQVASEVINRYAAPA